MKIASKYCGSEDRKEPYKTENRTNNTVQELGEMATETKREERKHSNAKEPHKSGKKTQQSH